MNVSVTLRRVRKSDLQRLMNWRNTDSIMKWCRQELMISFQDQDDWYERQHKDTTIEMFSIWNRKGDFNEHVGACGLTSIDYVNRRAEFSLYIAPKEHGNGLGRQALNALFKIGFNGLNLHLIWGETFEGNPAIKMFKDMGMTHEGTRRDFYFKNGHYIDAHIYSIKSTEVSPNE